MTQLDNVQRSRPLVKFPTRCGSARIHKTRKFSSNSEEVANYLGSQEFIFYYVLERIVCHYHTKTCQKQENCTILSLNSLNSKLFILKTDDQNIFLSFYSYIQVGWYTFIVQIHLNFTGCYKVFCLKGKIAGQKD